MERGGGVASPAPLLIRRPCHVHWTPYKHFPAIIHTFLFIFCVLFCSSLKNNANKNDRQTFQRSKSLYNPGGLKKKPLPHMKKSRTISNAETNGDSNGEVLLPKYKQMKCIAMEVKRSNFGRNGSELYSLLESMNAGGKGNLIFAKWHFLLDTYS